MDRARDLIDEYDLTPEGLHTKRRAEFDRWFDKPSVRLYEAVMLSMRIIPHSNYRLNAPATPSHPPRYPDEFCFRLDRPDFHDRMVLAVAAIRNGVLTGTQDPNSVNESEFRITLAEFERWAIKAKLPLPAEWRKKADSSTDRAPTPQQRRERNNLLRIIRALMRAAKIQGEASLLSVVAQAPLLAPPDQSATMQALRAIPLVDRQQDQMSPAERGVVRQIPRTEDLIGIIAALISIDTLHIDVRPRHGGVKRIAGYVDDDHHARGDDSTITPGTDMIEGVVKKVRALVDSDGANPS